MIIILTFWLCLKVLDGYSRIPCPKDGGHGKDNKNLIRKYQLLSVIIDQKDEP